MLAVNKVYSFLYRIALLGFPKQRVANKEINFDKSSTPTFVDEFSVYATITHVTRQQNTLDSFWS